MAGHSTPSRRRRKSDGPPPKPYKAYPLYAHASGHWAKKILGTFHYFGRWGRIRDGKMERLPYEKSWQDAKTLYDAQADDLHAGRTPRRGKAGEPTVGDLRDRFLTSKSRALDAKEIQRRTYDEYKATALLLVAQFGERRLLDDLVADDFEALRAEMAKRWGPVRLGNQIQSVRTIFKWAYDAGLIDRPVRFGPDFKKPSAKVLRLNRASNGKRTLTAAELRLLLDAADGKEVTIGTDEQTGNPVKATLTRDPQLRAMLLLGLNCGYGNHDCALLPLSAIDLDGGWISFPPAQNRH